MILALQTADATSRLWLIDEGSTQPPKPVSVRESGRALSDELLPQIMAVVQERAIELQDLTGLVIFSGPGSFTSLRIGHTVANALAESLKIPILGTQGEGWLKDGLQQLKGAQPGQIALPHYGAEAHITRPKA
ncbi:MAG TPA: hypothetical protein VLI05_01810 [Candidatus Saccharimonadia bacterium]|nr:hypothetical protein [Candidatus Saccharimonadia bacterium]